MSHRFPPRPNRTAALLLLVAAVAAALLPAIARADVTIVNNGKPAAKVYVTGPIELPELTPAETRALTEDEREVRQAITARQSAIDDLLYHVKQMSGAELEIVVTDKPADVKGPAIVFGDLATKLGATPQEDTVTDDSYRVIVKGDRILLGGEGDIAASHALYHLLYALGCDWVFPGVEGEVIPQQSTIAVKDMDVAKTPAFVVRSPWYSGGRNIINEDDQQQFDQWKRRQRQTHGRQIEHPDFMRGGHFWASLLNIYKKEFAEDPTMLPLVRQPDGTLKYGKSQLEPTHPGVVDLTVKWIDDQFEKNNWPNDKAVAFSIGPNDGGGYSQSPAATAAGSGRMDPIIGGEDQTDVLILYANKVLEAVEDKYPNLKLGFYIYSVHADFPMKYKPHPKFVAHFADITYSRYHAIEDRGSYTRNYYRNILEQWARLHEEQGNPMWFYGYNWNLAENMFPYSKLLIWGEDLPYYHEMGVLGHNNEQDKAWSILGPHNYLMARMGWDIDLKWQDVLKEYCQKTFGAAAPHMEQYYLHVVNTQKTGGHESGALTGVALLFDREFLKQAQDHISKARAAAKTDREKKMVDYFGQPVTALEIYHDYRDATFAFDFVKAREQFEKLMAHWQKYYDTNPNLVSKYAHRYYNNWMLGPYTETAKKYSTEPYKIVYKFPDAVPTIFDPENMGALMGFQNPEIKNEHQIETRTYGSTWDAQGLGPYRAGGVWYRLDVPVDKALEGQPIALMLGSVEDTVHVYLNGEYVGMGRGYIRPFTFDLTDHVKYGQDNLLALQIIRRSKLNEAGLGGILFPSYVFTGPQLEQKAPAQEPLRRVLPGGAEGELVDE